MISYKNKIFIALLSLLIFAACSHTGKTDTNTADSSGIGPVNDTLAATLPDVIKDLPVGIEVWHEPDTLRAVKWDKDTSRYIWKHQTFLFSYVADLKIIEFGTYNYKNGKWELGNLNQKLYGPEELETWYVQFDKGMVKWDHPDKGLIKKNVVYFDPSNYSIKNKNLVLRNGLWYFIGTDSTGKKYCGYGRYVALPEMMPSSQPDQPNL